MSVSLAAVTQKGLFRLISIAILFVGTSRGLEAQIRDLTKPLWSVSLEPQGYHHTYSKQAATRTVIGDVAATKDTVAVLLCIREQGSGQKIWTEPWDIFVILYEAETGKFLSRKGPWKSETGFRLWATPDGRLLLVLRSAVERQKTPGWELRLLSPQGEELKTLSLEESREKPSPKIGNSMNSPSGRTLLLVDEWAGEKFYRVIDANSLDIRTEWTEKQEREKRRVISISDEGMLGQSRSEYAVKRFEGPWRVLPNSFPDGQIGLAPNVGWSPLGFLSDDVIAGRFIESKDKFVWPMFQMDGTFKANFAIPRSPYYNYFSPFPPQTSQDGRYAAVRLQHENAITHWWDKTMDMWPAGASYFLYIWSTESASAIARIRILPDSQPMCFLPAETLEIAIVEAGTLKVFSFATNSTTH